MRTLWQATVVVRASSAAVGRSRPTAVHRTNLAAPLAGRKGCPARRRRSLLLRPSKTCPRRPCWQLRIFAAAPCAGRETRAAKSVSDRSSALRHSPGRVNGWRLLSQPGGTRLCNRAPRSPEIKALSYATKGRTSLAWLNSHGRSELTSAPSSLASSQGATNFFGPLLSRLVQPELLTNGNERARSGAAY